MKEAIPGLALGGRGDNSWQGAQTTLQHIEHSMTKAKAPRTGTRPLSLVPSVLSSQLLLKKTKISNSMCSAVRLNTV